jgi:DNA-binding GntR family transcriptional regulator
MSQLKSRAIYDALRSNILSGTLEAGQRLVLRAVSQEYGSSDIPAREALRMLEQDGLVEIVPYQGARVTILSPERVNEAYFVRGHLEALATELSTSRMTSRDFVILDGLVEQMEQSVHHPDPLVYAELNRKFHTYIVQHCGNVVLQDTIIGIWQAQSAFQMVFRLDPARQFQSNGEHRLIVDAMRVGDAARARELALEHKFATAVALTTALEHSNLDEVNAENVFARDVIPSNG